MTTPILGRDMCLFSAPRENKPSVPLHIEAGYGSQLNFLFDPQVAADYQILSRRCRIRYLQTLRVRIYNINFLPKHVSKNSTYKYKT